MIRFESIEKAEEIPSCQGKEVKYSDQNIKDAKNYWDRLFSPEVDINDVLLSEVCDCDENDFVFNFDVSDKSITDVLDDVRKNWKTVDNDGKIEMCKQFAAVIADELEISNPPKCVFFSDDEEGYYGFYSKEENSININTNYFSDAYETLNTIAHETRHAYQDHRAEIGETHTDELYKCNFDNYISLEYVDGYCVNFLDYQSQFIEAEARAFADIFKL